MKFERVVGQKKAKQNFKDAVSANKLGHAILISAKDGQGGLPFAIAATQYLLCEKNNYNKPAELSGGLFGEEEIETIQLADSCGECSNCIQMNELQHPDVHFSYPVIPKKSGDKPISTDYISEFRTFVENNVYGNNFDWLQSINSENKQGNITVNECDDISRKLSLKSYQGGIKVLIMWLPEYLGKEGNKLLKLIEEPPPKTILMFVTENEESILSTILSRLQSIRLLPLSVEEITEGLKLYCTREDVLVTKLAAYAKDNFRVALDLVNKNNDEDWEEYLKDWLNAAIRLGPHSQNQWISKMSALGRESQKDFLRYVLNFLQQSLYVKLGATGLQTDNFETAQKMSKLLDVEHFKVLVDYTNQAIFEIERNVSGKLVFHALTIKWYHLIKNNNVILLP